MFDVQVCNEQFLQKLNEEDILLRGNSGLNFSCKYSRLTLDAILCS